MLSTYYENVLDMKRASGVMSKRHLALHSMLQKPPAAPAPVAPAPAQDDIEQDDTTPAAERRRPAEDERLQQSSRKQINLVVLEEHCVVVFRNRTAIQLQA